MRTAPNRWIRCTRQPATAGPGVDPDAREYEVSAAGLVALLSGGERPGGELWADDRDDAGAYDRVWTPGTACRPYVGDTR